MELIEKLQIANVNLYGHIKTAEQRTIIRWLVHWPLMGALLHLVQPGGAWEGCGPTQSPHRCTECNSPSIDGQCTNLISFDVVLQLPLRSKGLRGL